MKYQESEVIDILKNLNCANPEKVLQEWKTLNFNVMLDLEDGYEFFIYTFPVIIDGDHVADVTLFENGHHFPMDELMSKYLGWKEWEGSYLGYSHYSYMHYCLTVKKQFDIDKPHESVFKDKNDKEIKYRLFTQNMKEAENLLEFNHDPNYYRCLFDDGIVLDIENTKIEGYELSERISHNIQQRLQLNTNTT